ncbi:MAG: hypothetical protein KGL59_01900 [Acidobacteriota bacterium]|nr:hypothetical protein [Acidobacteriota bacterium]
MAAWALASIVSFSVASGSALGAAKPQTPLQMAIPGHSSSLLQVGDKIPGFDGADQLGKQRDFANLRGRNGLVMLFFRSADW